jgi:hypothetical protein
MIFFGRAVQPSYVSRYPSHEITTVHIGNWCIGRGQLVLGFVSRLALGLYTAFCWFGSGLDFHVYHGKHATCNIESCRILGCVHIIRGKRRDYGYWKLQMDYMHTKRVYCHTIVAFFPNKLNKKKIMDII